MAVAIQPFAGSYAADPVHSSVLFSLRHRRSRGSVRPSATSRRG
jgi:hypothetical protein